MSFIDKLYVYVNIAMLRVFRPEQESKKEKKHLHR